MVRGRNLTFQEVLGLLRVHALRHLESDTREEEPAPQAKILTKSKKYEQGQSSHGHGWGCGRGIGRVDDFGET